METLGQFFSYNNDPETVRDVFLSLDNQMKLIHERGYSVDINSSSIVYENGLGFARFKPNLTEEERKNNVVDLAKLAVGTYFSLPTGSFSDYTHFPNDYIKDNFAIMETCILPATDNDNYYRDVLVNGSSAYYNDYLKELKARNSQNHTPHSNSRVLSYSTQEGRAMTNDNNKEAAFISIAFYPIMAMLLTIVSYAIYILVK